MHLAKNDNRCVILGQRSGYRLLMAATEHHASVHRKERPALVGRMMSATTRNDVSVRGGDVGVECHALSLRHGSECCGGEIPIRMIEIGKQKYEGRAGLGRRE